MIIIQLFYIYDSDWYKFERDDRASFTTFGLYNAIVFDFWTLQKICNIQNFVISVFYKILRVLDLTKLCNFRIEEKDQKQNFEIFKF